MTYRSWSTMTMSRSPPECVVRPAIAPRSRSYGRRAQWLRLRARWADDRLTKPMIDRQFLVDHSISYDASLWSEDYWFVADCVAAGANSSSSPTRCTTTAFTASRPQRPRIPSTTSFREDVASKPSGTVTGRRRPEGQRDRISTAQAHERTGVVRRVRRNDQVGQLLAAGSQFLGSRRCSPNSSTDFRTRSNGDTERVGAINSPTTNSSGRTSRRDSDGQHPRPRDHAAYPLR